MRFCGTCGSPLTVVAIAHSICFACGAPLRDLESNMEAAGAPPHQGGAFAARDFREDELWGLVAQRPNPPLGGIRAAQANSAFQVSPPEGIDVPGVPPSRPARGGRPSARRQAHLLTARGVAFGCGGGVLAAALGIVLLIGLLGHAQPCPVRGSTTRLPTASTTSHGSSNPNGSLPSPRDGTSQPSVSAGATPTGGPTATLTTQPVLTLSTTAIKLPLTACLASSTPFTITNSGGGELIWTARPSSGISVKPESGSLPAGGQQVVTATTHISVSGQIAMSAADAVHPSQMIRITCAL